MEVRKICLQIALQMISNRNVSEFVTFISKELARTHELQFEEVIILDTMATVTDLSEAKVYISMQTNKYQNIAYPSNAYVYCEIPSRSRQPCACPYGIPRRL